MLLSFDLGILSTTTFPPQVLVLGVSVTTCAMVTVITDLSVDLPKAGVYKIGMVELHSPGVRSQTAPQIIF